MTVKLTQSGYTDVTLESAKVEVMIKKAPKIRLRGIRKVLWAADNAGNPHKTEIIDYKKCRVDYIITGHFSGSTAVTNGRNLITMVKAGGLKTFTWDSFLASTESVTVITCDLAEEAGTKTYRLPYRLVLTEGQEKS